MLRRLLALPVLALALPAAASGPFRPLTTPAEVARLPQTTVLSRAASPFRFDEALFAEAVRGVAVERPDEVAAPATLLELPHPDGRLVLFRVVESPVMAPELAARFPEVRTFRGEGVDDPTASVRFDVSPRGFSAMVLSASGAWYVDPWTRGNAEFVAAYHRRDAVRDAQSTFRCEGPAARPGVPPSAFRVVRSEAGAADLPRLSVGGTLRTYRLALATTGEYSAFFGGTTALVHAELVAAVNRVVGIYERELSVRMTLVPSNDSLIFLNAATDGYSNDDGGAMLGQNQSMCDSVIGNASYDVGHVFSTGGGGVAYLGVVCTPGWKAGGVTGSGNPTGDAFWVDYVAHEMGHQFGANHTFDSRVSSCGGGNRNDPTAYEPGSGSTIMAYAGICGSENLQLNSDPYFHAASFDEIVAYISDTSSGQGGSCPTTASTGNSAPAVAAGADYAIPARTPFALTGSATDPEGDALTFGWEQLDLAATGTGTNGPPLVDDGSRPIFRSFSPTTSPTRVFPKLSDVLAGTATYGETLPTTTRTLTFRLTVRDNRAGGGGVDSDTTVLSVTNTGSAFSVTAPATAVSWPAGSTQTVTWNVAGTTGAPISCANVAIALSTDGGLTFPATLLDSTPNDGSQAVTLPATPTPGASARLKVGCVGNVFFAISRPSFTISAPVSSPTITAVAPATGPVAGGTTVTITGTNLTGATQVAFGGTAATSFSVDSATQVTATTPARAAGAVDVSVTTPAGTATATGAFTYVAPAPTVSGIEPASGTSLGGTAVTITGTGFLAGAAVALGGVPATSVVVVSPSTITAVTGARAAGLVDVVVTNPGGPSGTLAGGFTYFAGLRFYSVAPCRVLDTRNAPDGPLAGPVLAASPAERTLPLAPACGVPADARVVSANVTVAGASAPGTLRFRPADAPLSIATTIAFDAGRLRSNNAMLLLATSGGQGLVIVRSDAASEVHLIVDVNGYFR